MDIVMTKKYIVEQAFSTASPIFNTHTQAIDWATIHQLKHEKANRLNSGTGISRFRVLEIDAKVVFDSKDVFESTETQASK